MLWVVSLIVISFTTLVFAGINIANVDLPNIVVRILGVLDILAIPVLVFTTIKKNKKEN